MTLLKNHHINLAIVIAGIINAIVGGILIYLSFQGHSGFGVILGALLPLAALTIYGDGYRKYKNLEISKDTVKNVFKPSIKLGIILTVLMLILITYLSISQKEISIDAEYLYFFAIILLIFLIPNLLIQLGFFLFLKRKF